MEEASAHYTELVRHLGAGGADARAAEAEICRQFAPRIRLYGLRHLRDADRAADLVQVVLLATLEALRAGRVNEPEHLDRYVLGTCRNSAHRIREAEARLVAQPTEALDLGIVEQDTRAVDVEALFRCIAALAERPRAVLQLTFQEERTADDIASMLGTSPANVRVLRHRAVAQVRACVDAAGGKEAG